MKTCFKCGQQKPLSAFYRHPKMADGHLNKCKTCARKDAYEHRHGPERGRVLAYDRKRSKDPQRVEMSRKITAAWIESHPRERACQIAVGNAVRDGRLFKWPVCAVPECETKPVAHHPDYDQPLLVVWLCQAHHQQAHALTRPQEP